MPALWTNSSSLSSARLINRISQLRQILSLVQPDRQHKLKRTMAAMGPPLEAWEAPIKLQTRSPMRCRIMSSLLIRQLEARPPAQMEMARLSPNSQTNQELKKLSQSNSHQKKFPL
jgi:hypothetical protein